MVPVVSSILLQIHSSKTFQSQQPYKAQKNSSSCRQVDHELAVPAVSGILLSMAAWGVAQVPIEPFTPRLSSCAFSPLTLLVAARQGRQTLHLIVINCNIARLWVGGSRLKSALVKSKSPATHMLAISDIYFLVRLSAGGGAHGAGSSGGAPPAAATGGGRGVCRRHPAAPDDGAPIPSSVKHSCCCAHCLHA